MQARFRSAALMFSTAGQSTPSANEIFPRGKMKVQARNQATATALSILDGQIGMPQQQQDTVHAHLAATISHSKARRVPAQQLKRHARAEIQLQKQTNTPFPLLQTKVSSAASRTIDLFPLNNKQGNCRKRRKSSTPTAVSRPESALKAPEHQNLGGADNENPCPGFRLVVPKPSSHPSRTAQPISLRKGTQARRAVPVSLPSGSGKPLPRKLPLREGDRQFGRPLWLGRGMPGFRGDHQPHRSYFESSYFRRESSGLERSRLKSLVIRVGRKAAGGRIGGSEVRVRCRVGWWTEAVTVPPAKTGRKS